MIRLEILVTYNIDYKILRKLSKRYNGGVLAVVVVLEADSPQQLGALVKHYELKPRDSYPACL
ncbi:MAG: hypothetical protein GSR85_02605 [Desulfurococcales archaeon]|nr:hypothetical protein [Desulfurococcales archaeon]